MKKMFTLFLLVCLVKLSYAQPPAGLANAGDTYGEKIDPKGVATLSQVSKDLAKKDSVATKISGKVVASCPKKGCWMEVELEDKSKMFVKFKDYAFFVPMDIVGKSIVLDGIAFNKTTSVAELQHYAKDAKKSQAEIDGIKEPQKQLRFLADGVLVVK
ncbi:DUF4920 domain-containing protein [Niabella yanshanensis]|uniref:DUF4920 domain-containing protein n=1 Tax=Niabella yanshanensis TaxID=577386 RepID=A0ABZ0WBC2_9BACT|nr:DUF4920 domain-containing protein [Niabella yanshanensis]WQD40610.1 DUF4920 domain-containing protein [Niabella yanshanensis]